MLMGAPRNTLRVFNAGVSLCRLVCRRPQAAKPVLRRGSSRSAFPLWGKAVMAYPPTGSVQTECTRLPVMGYLSFRKSISAVDVLLQADKAYCNLTKKATFGAQHNRQRVHSVCIEPVGGYAMTAFPLRGKVERQLPRRKTGLAACGRRHTRRHNDTPALNTLKVLRGAPTSC